MSGRVPRRWSGVAWLVLIALPPAIILAGMAALFVWQVRKGAVTPKWKAPSVETNAVPGRETQR